MPDHPRTDIACSSGSADPDWRTNMPAFVIDACRSPRGRGKETGALHTLHPQEVLAQVLNALRERVGFDPGDVADVVVGNNENTGDHGSCIGRMAVLAAGWPNETPGTTVNRFCGSGQQAINFAAMGILSGQQQLAIGAGVESMSRWARTRSDLSAGNARLLEKHPLVPQGVSADLIATLEKFSREDLDAFAVESQNRAAVAIDEGRFDRSLVPISHPDGSVALDHDELPRPGTTLEGLAKLEPSFEHQGRRVRENEIRSYDDWCKIVYPQIDVVDHLHHAGNSSGIVDGAAAVLIASEEYSRAHGFQPRGRIVATALAGSEPVIMLTAPGPASQRCLRQAGMAVDDIDIWEINEAFAAVPLKTIRDLAIDPAKVNVNGGAIALGHPIGATGAMLIGTALDELERADKTTALVTMCTGGGMATATIIERI
jgi:acetyl-CoA C-acetyltransferase